MKFLSGKKETAVVTLPPATVELIAEQLKTRLGQKPAWVDELRRDLDHVAEAMGDLGEFRQQATADRTAVNGMAQSFAQLERIVNTGRACVNCNETRRELFEELGKELTRIYGLPASEDLKPEAYTTRSQAYQAGRQYVIAQLRNVIDRVKESRSISPDASWFDQNPKSL